MPSLGHNHRTSQAKSVLYQLENESLILGPTYDKSC